MIYYYEKKTGCGGPYRLTADNDEAAIAKLKEKHTNLINVAVLYVEEEKDNMRTVWIE